MYYVAKKNHPQGRIQKLGPGRGGHRIGNCMKLLTILGNRSFKEVEPRPMFQLPLTSHPPSKKMELPLFMILDPPSLNVIQIDLHYLGIC